MALRCHPAYFLGHPEHKKNEDRGRDDQRQGAGLKKYFSGSTRKKTFSKISQNLNLNDESQEYGQSNGDDPDDSSKNQVQSMNLKPVVDLGKKIVIDVESHILCRSTARKSLHLGEEYMTEVKVFTFTSVDVCRGNFQFPYSFTVRHTELSGLICG